MLVTATFTQSQERALVWYFGNHAGLDFHNDSPHELNDGSMIAEAGCSSICDASGNLLFYTNGKKVWNRNHQLMPDGDNLNGSQVLNQNSIITPFPGSDSIYYLFTISDLDTIRGFNYSIINMNKDNGLGNLTDKNIEIRKGVLEKITAIEHCNQNDYWIIVHGYINDFYSYLLTENGIIDVPVKSISGSSPKADIGYMKTSPRSDKIVLPINKERLLAEVFEFNNQTGVVDNPLKVFSKFDQTYCYGLAFSPNGNIVYLSTRGKDYQIWQYNLEETNEDVFNEKAIAISGGNNFAMQLAPNGKIYIAAENRPYVNAINNPNIKGKGCNYESEAVNFSQGISLMGLPNFVQSWIYKPKFEVENTCLGDTTYLSFNEIETTDSCSWKFFDTFDNHIFSSNNVNVFFEFDQTGKYFIELFLYHCGVTDVIYDTIEIYPYPVSSLVSDTSICNNCNLVLDAGPGFDSYLWSDSSHNQFMEIYYPGEYSVEISKNGCSSIDTIKVSEIIPELYLSNAFTPNGDGLNDEFMVVNPRSVLDFSMSIYCRRGTRVFYTNNVNIGWDGTYKGEQCYRDTFVWIIAYGYYNEYGQLVNESIKGVVTLIR